MTAVAAAAAASQLLVELGQNGHEPSRSPSILEEPVACIKNKRKVGSKCAFRRQGGGLSRSYQDTNISSPTLIDLEGGNKASPHALMAKAFRRGLLLLLLSLLQVQHPSDIVALGDGMKNECGRELLSP